MYKIQVNLEEDGGYRVDKECNHTNALEVLTLIDSLIKDIEERNNLSFKAVIKCIKDTRKCVKTRIIEDDNIDNTNE